MERSPAAGTVRELVDADQVALRAAEEFCGKAAEAVAARGRFTVALSGGSTPRRLFRRLAELAAAPGRAGVDWDQIHFFWGDERMVPFDHPDSNFRTAWELLLKPLGVSAANIHRVETERGAAVAVAAAYEAELVRFFGSVGERSTCFDLILLGLGPDGHTASLFPGTTHGLDSERLVVAVYVEKFNAYRVSLTPQVLNLARSVVFLVAGEDKATALEAVLEGPLQPDHLPAQLVQPSPGGLLWLVDRSAARLLKRRQS